MAKGCEQEGGAFQELQLHLPRNRQVQQPSSTLVDPRRPSSETSTQEWLPSYVHHPYLPREPESATGPVLNETNADRQFELK